MAGHPIRTAAATESGVVESTLLEAIVKRTPFALNVGESLSGFDFDVGEPPLAVVALATGYLYVLDTTDSTTADDGLTCLVSGNGLRYHIEDAASLSLNSILSFETSPPGTPTVGDAHIVGTGATGDFAGHDDDMAVYTRRGWVFAGPEMGLTVYNEDDDANWQYTDAGWTGFAVEFAAGSIPPEALEFPAGLVVQDTLNAPPGSPVAGQYWIVGSSPSGAFSGHAGDLARYTGSGWTFIDPEDGWSVGHAAYGFAVVYDSGTWSGPSGSEIQTFTTAGADTWTKPSRGTMAFIEVWGGGGSGGRAGASDGGGGGGGGSYACRFVPLASLSATESVTVGAGGVARTSDNQHGAVGGTSSFGSLLSAYGGGGGCGNVSGGGGGGGGAGQGGAGTTATTATGATGGVDAVGGSIAGSIGGTGGTGNNSNSVAAAAGSASIDGGGGGGGGNGDIGGGGIGGKSINGGAGGGGALSGGGTGAAGGTSLNGGAGGQGGRDGASAGQAGSQPGGGGGGSGTSNSGKGGDGMVRVTVF